MSVSARLPVRGNGLSHTTLRIGRGLPTSSIAEVIHALQRVPGVLTVDADVENAQAFVAHDAAVPLVALVAAANRSGAAAISVTASSAAAIGGAPQGMQRRPLLAGVGLAAMLLLVLIDIAFPNDPEKRWLFVVPVILLWGFTLLRAMLVRRS